MAPTWAVPGLLKNILHFVVYWLAPGRHVLEMFNMRPLKLNTVILCSFIFGEN